MSSINKRAFLAGLGAVSVARAQTPLPPPDFPPAIPVALTTPLGIITVGLAWVQAPITCANFLRYVDAKRFDGAAFYRAVHAGSGTTNGLVQGGLRNDPAKVFPPIAHESTMTTGLRHVDGTISMARYAPGSAQAEFFICVGDQLYLDADPSQPGDNLGFAAFGHVVSGMDVARAILAAPTSPTEGEGVMKGQMLSPMVAIVTARRLGS
jgi:peptidyl-prolyl cis-trans isomerase A (cyclophilin A)